MGIAVKAHGGSRDARLGSAEDSCELFGLLGRAHPRIGDQGPRVVTRTNPGRGTLGPPRGAGQSVLASSVGEESGLHVVPG